MSNSVRIAEMQWIASFRMFGKFVQVPILLLFVAEAVVAYVSYYAGVALRFGGFGPALVALGGEIWPRALVFAVAVMVSLYAMGLFHTRIRQGTVGIMLRVGAACLVGALGATLVYYAVPSLYTGRGAHFLAVGIAFVLLTLVRLGLMRIIDEAIFKRRVLIIGTGKKAQSLTRLRRRSDQRGFSIVGYVVDEEANIVVPAEKVIVPEPSLLEYALQNGIDEIVVASDDRRKNYPIRDLLDCRLSGIQVTDIIGFFERQSGKVRLDLLYPSWLIFSGGFEGNSRLQIFKRAFDILISLVLLLLAWPVMLICALLIWAESRFRDPVFYIQTRVGYRNKPFRLYKFRSMRVNAEETGGVQWAAADDDRTTNVGKWIRKTRIDELPQLFNVLIGDMAFVGPRPERPEFVEQLGKKIPYYHERHSVKPGITGWAQLSYPYGSSDEDARHKLEYDLYYVKHQTLLFDFQIILQTVEVVLFGKGAR